MRGEDVGGTVGGCVSLVERIDQDKIRTAHGHTKVGRVRVLEVVQAGKSVEVVVGTVHEVVGLLVEDVFHVCGLHCEMRQSGGRKGWREAEEQVSQICALES